MTFKFISNFVGGLNNFLPPKFLKSNEAQKLNDADIRKGQIESVKGPLLAHPGVGGYYVRNFVADSGINLWFTHNNPILYVDFMNAVYFSAPNELSDIYKKSPDGGTTYQIGVDNPTIAPALALDTTQTSFFSAGETVQYIYTAHKHGSESSPSPVAEIEIQNDGESVKVTVPNAADLDASTIRIYRAGGGAGDFLMVGEITGGDFIDSLSGSELGAACDSWGNERPPQGLILDAYYRGYFIGHVERSSELRFSNITNIESWNPLHSIRFDSPIIRAVPYAGSIVVFCESGIYQLVGNTIDDITKAEIPTEQVCVSAKSVIVHSNMLFFQSPDGICAFDGANVTVVSQPKIAKSFFAGRKFVAEGFDGRLFFGDEHGLLSIDTNFGMAFAEFSSITNMTDMFYNVWDDKLYIANLTDIYQLFEGDDVPLLYKSGNLGNGLEDGQGSDISLKTFRTVRLLGSGTFSVTLSVDDAASSFVQSITLDPNVPKLLFFPRHARGYAGQVQLEGIGSVSGIHVEYYVEGVDING